MSGRAAVARMEERLKDPSEVFVPTVDIDRYALMMIGYLAIHPGMEFSHRHMGKVLGLESHLTWHEVERAANTATWLTGRIAESDKGHLQWVV